MKKPRLREVSHMLSDDLVSPVRAVGAEALGPQPVSLPGPSLLFRKDWESGDLTYCVTPGGLLPA